MKYTEIIYEISNKILTITLNRPQNLNSVTRVMATELVDAFDSAAPWLYFVFKYCVGFFHMGGNYFSSMAGRWGV